MGRRLGCCGKSTRCATITLNILFLILGGACAGFGAYLLSKTPESWFFVVQLVVGFLTFCASIFGFLTIRSLRLSWMTAYIVILALLVIFEVGIVVLLFEFPGIVEDFIDDKGASDIIHDRVLAVKIGTCILIGVEVLSIIFTMKYRQIVLNNPILEDALGKKNMHFGTYSFNPSRNPAAIAAAGDFGDGLGGPAAESEVEIAIR